MNTDANVEETTEVALGAVLRWGTIIAALVIGLGGIAFLTQHGGELPHYGLFRGEPDDLKSVRGIVADAAHRDPQGWIQLGLLLLVATPIARVIGALLAFAYRRDLTYVVISSLVLAGLLYGLLAS